MTNSDTRENLKQIVAAMQEFQVGMESMKQRHSEGNHKAVGEAVEMCETASKLILQNTEQVLESMKAHEPHECPECEKREAAAVREVIGDTCSWCGRSFGKMLRAKEQAEAERLLSKT